MQKSKKVKQVTLPINNATSDRVRHFGILLNPENVSLNHLKLPIYYHHFFFIDSMQFEIPINVRSIMNVLYTKIIRNLMTLIKIS